MTFTASAALALAGAGAAVTSTRHRRVSLAGLAVGVACMYASLSAGFAALVALICYLAIAASATAWGPTEGAGQTLQLARQLAAAAAGVIVLALVALSFGSALTGIHYPGGWFGAAGAARTLFFRDPIATIAVAAALTVAGAGARRRPRPRDAR